MKKRLIALIAAAALLLTMSGCGALYNSQYRYEADFTDADADSGDGKSQVRNYYTLKQAILELVSERETEGYIVFGEYDGDISTDLNTACWELRMQNALCAYCVRSISYELSHIVSFEEASISIDYSRTAEEMEEIVSVAYSTGMRDHLTRAVEALEEKAVLLVTNSALDEDGVLELISDIYFDDPLCAVSLPRATVHMYSGMGLQRLFEVELDYSLLPSDISARRLRTEGAVSAAVNSCQSEEPAATALNICEFVLNSCAYSAASGASTVYDALVAGTADSAGMALAFKALCNEMGIECEVVSGILNQNDHYWNIITLGDDGYHIDVSRCTTDGIAAGFMRSDEAMWQSYRWDTSKYPQCDGTLGYEDAAALQNG